MLNHVAQSAGIESHHRRLAKERLDRDEAEALVDRRNDDGSRPLIEGRQLGLRKPGHASGYVAPPQVVSRAARASRGLVRRPQCPARHLVFIRARAWIRCSTPFCGMSLPTKRRRWPSRDEPGAKRSVATGIGATVGLIPGTSASVSSFSQLETVVTAAECFSTWLNIGLATPTVRASRTSVPCKRRNQRNAREPADPGSDDSVRETTSERGRPRAQSSALLEPRATKSEPRKPTSASRALQELATSLRHVSGVRELFIAARRIPEALDRESRRSLPQPEGRPPPEPRHGRSHLPRGEQWPTAAGTSPPRLLPIVGTSA